MSTNSDKPLLRSLGEFFGHVWKGVTTDPTKTVTKREVQEQIRETPQGQVTIRRTTIEEIEVRPPDAKK